MRVDEQRARSFQQQRVALIHRSRAGLAQGRAGRGRNIFLVNEERNAKAVETLDT